MPSLLRAALQRRPGCSPCLPHPRGKSNYTTHHLLPAAYMHTEPGLSQGMTAVALGTLAYPIQAGDTVLVHAAAGGTGQLITQARAAGCTHVDACHMPMPLCSQECCLACPGIPWSHLHDSRHSCLPASLPVSGGVCCRRKSDRHHLHQGEGGSGQGWLDRELSFLPACQAKPQPAREGVSAVHHTLSRSPPPHPSSVPCSRAVPSTWSCTQSRTRWRK